MRGLQILAPPNLVQITHLSTHLGGQPSCLPWQNANGEGKAKAGVLLITAPGMNSSHSFYFASSSPSSPPASPSLSRSVVIVIVIPL